MRRRRRSAPTGELYYVQHPRDATFKLSFRPESASVEVISCDLSSLASVRTCAEQLLETVPRIDFLINNAGVFSADRQETADGFEMTFGVNHLGHFLLTEMLLPLVKKSADTGFHPR